MEATLLEELYRRYSPSVFRRACALMGNREAGKDIMQEVFLRAFEARAEFTAAASPLSWLYRITTNACLNRLRDGRRRSAILKRGYGPDEPVERPTTDDALTVRALLDRVPDDLQEIIVYYFVDQMSQDEIATMLSIPRRTIGYRLEKFRVQVLAAAGGEDLAS